MATPIEADLQDNISCIQIHIGNLLRQYDELRSGGSRIDDILGTVELLSKRVDERHALTSAQIDEVKSCWLGLQALSQRYSGADERQQDTVEKLLKLLQALIQQKSQEEHHVTGLKRRLLSHFNAAFAKFFKFFNYTVKF